MMIFAILTAYYTEALSAIAYKMGVPYARYHHIRYDHNSKYMGNDLIVFDGVCAMATIGMPLYWLFRGLEKRDLKRSRQANKGIKVKHKRKK